MRYALYLFLSLLVASNVVWYWYTDNLGDCQFARGLKYVQTSVVSLDGIPIYTSSPLKVTPGDYKACANVGLKL